MIIKGKCSWFGGPNDTGVSPSEGLAFIYELDDAPHLFLSYQPQGTTGLARRLDPDKYYIACRWDYAITPKEDLLGMKVKVRARGKEFEAEPADWGPHQDTGRVADLSPGLMGALGITTDDVVEVEVPTEAKPFTVVISSGHGLKIRGASGILDEVNEARRIVKQTVLNMQSRNATVYEFHDDTSTTQQQNLQTIVNFHNRHKRNLDISVHFNAYQSTDKPMGTECLYVSQKDLAGKVASMVSDASGLINRGAKHRTNLYFLNKTSAPSILIEVCFVDSNADAMAYNANIDKICWAITNAVVPLA